MEQDSEHGTGEDEADSSYHPPHVLALSVPVAQDLVHEVHGEGCPSHGDGCDDGGVHVLALFRLCGLWYATFGNCVPSRWLRPDIRRSRTLRETELDLRVVDGTDPGLVAVAVRPGAHGGAELVRGAVVVLALEDFPPLSVGPVVPGVSGLDGVAGRVWSFDLCSHEHILSHCYGLWLGRQPASDKVTDNVKMTATRVLS